VINFGDDPDHRPDPGVRNPKSGFTGLLAFGGGLCSLSTSSCSRYQINNFHISQPIEIKFRLQIDDNISDIRSVPNFKVKSKKNFDSDAYGLKTK